MLLDLTQDDDSSDVWASQRVQRTGSSALFSQNALKPQPRSVRCSSHLQDVIVIDGDEDDHDDHLDYGSADDGSIGEFDAIVHYEPDDFSGSQMSVAMEMSQEIEPSQSEDNSRHSVDTRPIESNRAVRVENETRDTEKLRKAQERAQAREARAKAKAAEKEAQRLARAAEKESRAQDRGTFAGAEVMVIMEQGLRESEVGVAVAEKLAELYSVSPGRPHSISGLIKWTRRDFTLGGAAESGDGVEDLAHICVFFHNPSSFYELMTSYRPSHHDFPALSQEVERIRRLTSEGCAAPRVCLLLYDIEAEINRQMRSQTSRGGGRISLRVLEEVVTYLLVHENVDCRILKSQADAAEHLESITRALATARYRDELNEYVGVQRYKSTTHFGAEHWRTLEGDEKELVMLRDAWLHQLQAIPGVSEAKARSVLRHFPNPQALIHRLTDESVPEQERINLLQDKFSDAGRNERTLACKVFKVLTSRNPSEQL